jgi:DNA-binding NtrC family response regulator
VERMTLATGSCRSVKDWRNYEYPVGQRDLILLQSDRSASKAFVETLKSEGWNPIVFSDRREAQKLLKLKEIYVGLVFIGADFNEEAQGEFMEVMGQSPSTEWIAIVDPTLVNAIEHAAFLREFFFDFHTAPIEIGRLAFSLGHAYGAAKLGEAGHREFRAAVNQKFGLIGSSRVMCRVFVDMEKISRSDEPVIITGETGTGKELVARAIHGQSRRAAKPFVTVNCGAIPDTLVQSELFGHNKGAFTGAADARIGYLEAAAGGTVFLDGIEDLSPLGQVTLLRFLQEKTVTRIGGKDTVPVDVRIIASASPSLTTSVAQGAVREDLYYRLNVLQVDVPPLRERGADAVEIAEYVIERFNRERKKDLKRLARNAIDRILDYPWPGNVRELIASVNRAAVLTNGRLITVTDLGLPGVVKFTGKTLREIKSHAVEQALIWALTETKNISSAARQLGVSRVTLYRLMEKHAIRSPNLHGVGGLDG